MFQQLRAAVVDLRRRGIGFEGSAGELVREVFARVEVFEHAGDGVQVVVDEFDARVARRRELLGEEGGLGEKSSVRHKEGLRIPAADEEFDHGGFEVARRAIEHCNFLRTLETAQRKTTYSTKVTLGAGLSSSSAGTPVPSASASPPSMSTSASMGGLPLLIWTSGSAIGELALGWSICFCQGCREDLGEVYKC